MKDDCYWREYVQDMGATLLFCKLRKGIDPISPMRDCQGCHEYHSKYKKTNADRIRSMSDEELAMEMSLLVCEAFDQVFPELEPMWGIDREGRIFGTAKDLLKWLQEESE